MYLLITCTFSNYAFVFSAFLKKYVDGKIDILETTMNDKKYIKSKTTTYSLVSEMNLLTGALTKKVEDNDH